MHLFHLILTLLSIALFECADVGTINGLLVPRPDFRGVPQAIERATIEADRGDKGTELSYIEWIVDGNKCYPSTFYGILQ